MDLSEAEKLIATSSDYRLLRRVPSVAAWSLQSAAGETRRAVLVDTETTGLDQDTDEVVELALLPFDYEKETGRIVAVHEPLALSEFREPTLPISDDASAINGITNDMVRGRTINPERVRGIIEPAHLVIAHNAGFDRPMVEKHWSIFEEKNWACSLVDIDWRAERVGSAKLDYLLYSKGWFHDGHRALSDALATLFLLTLPLPHSKDLALASLLRNARTPLRAVRAEETAFEQRASLKARGYRWDDGEGKRTKAWWIMTSNPAAEIEWLRADIYRDQRDIPIVNVPPTRRYSSRLWPHPQ